MAGGSVSPSDGPRLVLILSTERSGSTLLSAVLGAHSRVLAPPEMHLLAYPVFEGWRKDYPLATSSLRFLLASVGLNAGDQEMDKWFAGWKTESIYQWILSVAKGPSFIVDKTPRYARDRSALHRAERLEPFYVWLIRHPLGVTFSFSELWLKQRRKENARLLPFLKYPLFRLRHAFSRSRYARERAAYWLRVNERIERFLESIDPKRHLRIHYESLVRSPEPQIGRVLSWLGLSFETAVLDPSAGIPASLQWGLGDDKILSTNKIEEGRADSWKAVYRENLLNHRIRQAMARWGVR